MKILLVSLAGIGDTLLATPLLRALREQLPQAQIDALVMWGGSRDLLEGNRRLNAIHYCNLLENSHLHNLRFLLGLRRLHYDLSINTFPQGKIHYRVIARFINARRRLSHAYENHSRLDRWLVTDSIPQDYEVHCIENNLKFLPLLDLRIPTGLDCEFFYTAGEAEWAAGFAQTHAFAQKKVLGLHVGSGKTKNLILKRWPLDHYLALCRELLAAVPDLVLLLFGGPEEHADNQRLIRELQSNRVLPVPSRTIKQAAALLGHCDVFVSVDNAFMHLAATMKVPRQIVIESPTFNKTIDPYGRPFQLVRNPLVAGRNLDYYRYDGRDIQGGREHLLACMRSITPAMVLEAVQKAIEE
jgi:ADP-heptose:LPS heptosyltransferase